MQKSVSMRRRVPSLDGTSFRCERKAHTLFVNDMPAQVHVEGHGIVALITTHKTVRVSAATYWELIYDDLAPTRLSAGTILAKYDELVGQLQRIAAEGNPQP
ncbi:MAG TPA: hypothetical protein VFA10_29415 [Ktedonobacteraceae bacterium]|nr:hypothetical protein [Ktedonobacteraceae bacterium]